MKGNDAAPGWPRRIRAFAPWLTLFALWVILSGKFDVFHLSLGVLTVMALYWLHRGLQPMRPAGAPGIRTLRLVPYVFWLLKEMLLSAIYVARVILKPDRHLDPRLVRFEAEQPTLVNAVLFAHSITLTPGTITLDLKDNVYLVHALSPVTGDGLLEGAMSQRVAQLSVDEPKARPRPLPLTAPTTPPEDP